MRVCWIVSSFVSPPFLIREVEECSFYIVIGHRKFKLGTGQVIPVLVKAEKVVGEPPSGDTPWEKVELCTEPPPMLLPN